VFFLKSFHSVANIGEITRRGVFRADFTEGKYPTQQISRRFYAELKGADFTQKYSIFFSV